jgi:hypothetical protein
MQSPAIAGQAVPQPAGLITTTTTTVTEQNDKFRLFLQNKAQITTW